MFFLDVFVGFPGSVHDNRVLTNSPLAERAINLFSDGGFLLADAGYSTRGWVVPAFRDVALTAQEEAFNRAHCHCRCVIERTFGVLKGQWRILKGMDCSVKWLTRIAFACCVLHNLCREEGGATCVNAQEENETAEFTEEEDATGSALREQLVTFMCG
jgi:hypothetical protein